MAEVLAEVALTPDAEILIPREGRVELRRTPIDASGKTLAETPRVSTNHRGIPRGLSSSIFAQLVQFVFGWQEPLTCCSWSTGRVCCGVFLGDISSNTSRCALCKDRGCVDFSSTDCCSRRPCRGRLATPGALRRMI